MDLEIFSDASFGDECQGCVVVKWGGAPILWKSSRQAILTTSTAGAELLEVMEGATMGEAVKVDRIEMQSRTKCSQLLVVLIDCTPHLCK